MAGVWMSRLLKNNLMDDVFNMENESFMQENTADAKRVFGELADTLLLQKEMEQRVDQTSSIPSVLQWYLAHRVRVSLMPL